MFVDFHGQIPNWRKTWVSPRFYVQISSPEETCATLQSPLLRNFFNWVFVFVCFFLPQFSFISFFFASPNPSPIFLQETYCLKIFGEFRHWLVGSAIAWTGPRPSRPPRRLPCRFSVNGVMTMKWFSTWRHTPFQVIAYSRHSFLNIIVSQGSLFSPVFEAFFSLKNIWGSRGCSDVQILLIKVLWTNGSRRCHLFARPV